MKVSEITKIHVEGRFNGQYSLSWRTAEARYHVWLDKETRQMHDNILYKNPPEGVEYKGPGYFPTRYLKVSDKVNRVVFDFVFWQAQITGLFEGADREKQAEEARERAISEARCRIHLQKEAGPALYVALKALLDEDYVLTTGNKGHLVDNARRAVASAEKPS